MTLPSPYRRPYGSRKLGQRTFFECLDCGPRPVEAFYIVTTRGSVSSRCKQCEALASRKAKDLRHEMQSKPCQPYQPANQLR